MKESRLYSLAVTIIATCILGLFAYGGCVLIKVPFTFFTTVAFFVFMAIDIYSGRRKN